MDRVASFAMSIVFVSLVGALAAACQSAPATPSAGTPASLSAEKRTGDVRANVAPATSSSAAGVKHSPGERVAFRLYKILNPIGVELDTYVKTDDGSTEAK